ncbi:MAG: metal ABC transporter ATP-binding protein [Clostridia bacterium]
MKKILELKGVTFGYDGIPVVSNLNFNVSNGDYLCILGENGAGKSTLMKGILGLLKPISGEMTFEDGFSKRDIGYLTQQSQVQRDFPASVREVVLQGCQSRMGLRPFYNKNDKELAQKSMQKLGIENLSKRCYRELSGGQQQRVLLARALCSTQKILFLDEPATGLDPNVVSEFYSIIEQLNKTEKITIIMISHDIQSSLKYATHILHIGTKHFFGTKEEYEKSNDVNKFYNDTEGE